MSNGSDSAMDNEMTFAYNNEKRVIMSDNGMGEIVSADTDAFVFCERDITKNCEGMPPFIKSNDPSKAVYISFIRGRCYKTGQSIRYSE